MTTIPDATIAAAMLLGQITLKNILSFKATELELRTLNVLIGPNASGKTNFIDAVSLLHAAQGDLQKTISDGGGVREWIWKGADSDSAAVLECRLALESAPSLIYRMEFSAEGPAFFIRRERLEEAPTGSKAKSPRVHFDRNEWQAAIQGTLPPGSNAGIAGVQPGYSFFTGYRNPKDPTPITQVGQEFQKIVIFREFRTGPHEPVRTGVSTAARKDFLEDGGDNLAVVLQEIDFSGHKARIDEFLRRLSEQIKSVRVRLEGTVARVWVQEEHLRDPTPAVRLSDGTLKFLCLLAILLHPEPPSLICIEEPELGLHPDALKLVAEALVESSDHTQLIVTTHSEALIAALSNRPEAVVVCERNPDGSSRFQRLRKKQLDVWLKRYTLGELWRKGEIGGNRW